ncbi:hypothetical protein OFM15_34500, partial [Escherichia coli]|nr:hypothetical protein [Escherichia coli]
MLKDETDVESTVFFQVLADIRTFMCVAQTSALLPALMEQSLVGISSVPAAVRPADTPASGPQGGR